MNINQIRRFAIEFLEQHYSLPLTIPVEINNRLRSTHGRFIVRNNAAYKIELAGYLLEHGTTETITGVLKHECIHFALFMKNSDYRDGDHVFENELHKHHAPRTNTIRVGKYYQFQCKKCKKVSETAIKRIVTKSNQYRSRCCNAKIRILGESIYNGSINFKKNQLNKT